METALFPVTGYFFLCLFLRKRFLRLWVAILCLFLFFPLGIIFWFKVFICIGSIVQGVIAEDVLSSSINLDASFTSSLLSDEAINFSSSSIALSGLFICR